ncbi:MAG: 2-keto-4-pentenoate hydratase [Bradymonadaceae bacterium]
MTPETLNELATIVDDAARNTRSIHMLTGRHPELTIEDAYKIQRASMTRRVERGERIVGMKMGLTSLAKMKQMGVHNPIYGHLTNTMELGDGATISKSNYCHPRVEPEIAFIMGGDLHGPTTPQRAMKAVGSVCAALEVIDSRYENFKFTLIDVVADNASSTGFALGTKVVGSDELDIGNLGMVMEINGEVRETGSSAAILEHPARSLAKLADMLAEEGEYLKAGQIVLAGGATAAVALAAGDHVRLTVDGLGTVELRVDE